MQTTWRQGGSIKDCHVFSINKNEKKTYAIFFIYVPARDIRSILIIFLALHSLLFLLVFGHLLTFHMRDSRASDSTEEAAESQASGTSETAENQALGI